MTISNVEQTTATSPLVRLSNKIVNVEFTRTLPSKILHRRKLPWSRTGWIAFAYRFSMSEPVLHKIWEKQEKRLKTFLRKLQGQLTLRSVRSSDISPRLRPEKSAEKHKQVKMMQIWNQSGRSCSWLFKLIQSSLPW